MVLINYGPDAGKIATVIDVVDQKRILIDGPLNVTGVQRQVISTKRVNLTDVKVEKLPRSATQKTITKCWAEQGTKAKWEATAWAKKIAAKRTRANLSDFDRFKVLQAKRAKKALLSK